MFDIDVVKQSAQNPDIKVDDLAFFQSLLLFFTFQSVFVAIE